MSDDEIPAGQLLPMVRFSCPYEQEEWILGIIAHAFEQGLATGYWNAAAGATFPEGLTAEGERDRLMVKFRDECEWIARSTGGYDDNGIPAWDACIATGKRNMTVYRDIP